MGCFSWMFANTGNKKPLRIGSTGYLICPDNTVYKTEGSYDGYGRFGPKDSHDVYDEVANWNREILAKQPDYEVPQHGRFWDEETKSYIERKSKKLSEFPWWPFYSDLSLTPEQITQKMRDMTNGGRSFWEYRWIGIDLSVYDDQNAKLPYPIKISSAKNVKYDELPPSNGDPDQGFRGGRC